MVYPPKPRGGRDKAEGIGRDAETPDNTASTFSKSVETANAQQGGDPDRWERAHDAKSGNAGGTTSTVPAGESSASEKPGINPNAPRHTQGGTRNTDTPARTGSGGAYDPGARPNGRQGRPD